MKSLTDASFHAAANQLSWHMLQPRRTYGDVVADDGGFRPLLCIVLGHMDDHIVKHIGVAADFDAVDVPCNGVLLEGLSVDMHQS